MNIDTLIRPLGPVDSSALAEAILALGDEAWQEEELRQQVFDVHRETQSIVLVFVDLERWPELEVRKEVGWDRLADVAVPVMHDIIARCYPKGGTIIRSMVAKLPAGKKIKPHTDTHPSFHIGHRIHIPIKTNPRVRFMIDGRPHKMEFGQAYEINNQKNHSVMNKGAEERINFIFDYVPPTNRSDVRPQANQASEPA